MKRMYLVFMLLASHTLCHEHQDSSSPASRALEAPQSEITSCDNNPLKKRVFVPLWAITPDQNIYNPHQRNLFFAAAALAGAVGKMLVESGTALSLIEGATSLMKAFITNNAATTTQSESFMQELAHFIQEQAQSLLGAEKEKNKKNQS